MRRGRCGWPKGSRLEGTIREQWTRLQKERRLEITEWPNLDNDSLGLNDWEARGLGVALRQDHPPEMDEVIAQFTAYAGERRGELLRAAVADDLLGKSLANR